MIHISLKSETIFSWLGFPFTNSILLSILVMIGSLISFIYYFNLVKNNKKNFFYHLMNLLLRTVYNFFKSILNEKTAHFFPLIGSFFFFILIHNEVGLFPGIGSFLIKVSEEGYNHFVPLLRGGTTDLNTTFALAFVTVIYAQYLGIKFLGIKEYLKKYFNFSSVMAFFTGIMETISEFSRIVSYSFRLYGNIFAGEVVIAIMAFLFPILLSFPFLLFEMFIGVIQALVFSMLSAVFYNLAMEKAHY
ncbi:MAG: F0F1 ATP synthase subunit A [bacterium]